MSFWVVGFELEGFLEKFYDFAKSSLHPADGGKVCACDVISCPCGNECSVDRFCFFKFVLIDQCNSLLFLGSVISKSRGDLLLGA